jgi:hypothetical protein
MKSNTVSTRVDLRIPNEIYETIVKIAIQNEAPINKKTGNVTITSTVISLLTLGIESAKEKKFFV